jgi:AsmA protein
MLEEVAMNKALKIIGIIAAVVVVVIVGLTLFVKSYLTDERIRVLVTESAESSLNREVSLGAISVGIFRGISVKDFEIKEKDSDSAFVKADAFVLKYQLLPLLSRKLIIDELGIESPKIFIRKNSDGSFNFSDMGQEGDDAKKEKGGPSGLPVDLSVQSLRIDKGTIEYSDPTGAVKKAVVGLDAEMAILGQSREVMGSSGTAKIVVREIALKERTGSSLNMSVSIGYRIQAYLAEKKLEITEASLTAPGFPAVMKGTVNYGDPFSYMLEVNAESVDLGEMQKAAQDLLPEGIVLEGGMTVHIAAEQKPVKDAKPVFSGEVKLNNAGVRVNEMKPVFSGTVNLSPERIAFSSLKLVAGDSSADISGSITNYSAEPDIRIDMTSSMLNLDSLMLPTGKGESGSGAPVKSGKEGKEEKEFGPLKTKIRAEGNVDVAKLLFKGITVENVKARYSFRNNVFSLTPLTGNTLSGSFSVKSTVDLSKRGAVYTLNAATDGVKLEEITAAFAPKAKENLFGSLTASADISGAGSVSGTIKRNLKGKGLFSVKNGKIKNAQIADGLLTLLGLQNLKEIPMEKAEGVFTISSGVIDLKSVIASKDLVLNETGTIGMDQKLDMGILVKVSDNLSPRLVSQSGISRFLSEEKGWTSIPLKLSGTLSKPSYGVDTQAIGKRATETIQKRVEEELFKALSGDKGKKKSPDQPQQESQPAGPEEKKKSSPEDLLKGLFK